MYSSLRARTQQNAQSRDQSENILRDRLDYLESILSGTNRENNRLVERLSEAEKKLSQLQQRSGPKFAIGRLPDDVLGKVLQYVDGCQLASMSCTDKRFRELCRFDQFWRDHYQMQWGEDEMKRARHLSRGLNRAKYDTVYEKSWKDLYGERQELQNNWKMQKANVTNLEAHSGTVTCLALRGNRLFSGSDDGSMIFWSLDDGSSIDVCDETIQRLVPPPALPLAQLVDAMSSSSNTSVFGGPITSPSANFHHKLYSKKGGKKKLCAKTRTFHGHGGPVWCVGDVFWCSLFLFSSIMNVYQTMMRARTLFIQVAMTRQLRYFY